MSEILTIEGLKTAGYMFLFLAIEMPILFLVISYGVGILQVYISPTKIQSILSSKNGRGYIIAAFLGAITPFCSCSTIPFLKGLLRARAGFGPMMVFLFASPLLNPVVIGLLIVSFGFAITAYYFTVALVVSVVAGYVLEMLHFEKYVKDASYRMPAELSSQAERSDATENEQRISCNNESACSSNSSCGEKTEAVSSCGASCTNTKAKITPKWLEILKQTLKDFKKVLPYLFFGIAVGSFIYGFVPTEFISQWAGENNILSIPFSAIIGVPLYIRTSAVIPLSAALMVKGMNVGAVMALIIGSGGASLTEVILLKSMFKNPLIIAFLIVIFGMAMLAGYGLYFGVI